MMTKAKGLGNRWGGGGVLLFSIMCLFSPRSQGKTICEGQNACLISENCIHCPAIQRGVPETRHFAPRP